MTTIEKAVNILQDAEAILITAGAGMGVDSGLPDFRGNEGFWQAYPPIARLGKSFYEMANPEWFHRDPKLAWAFYGHRLNLYRGTVPHQGFHQLLEVANQKKGGYFVFTSNVDGQFQKAGFDDDKIEECHGSIHHFQCVQPCCHDIWDASNETVKIDEEVFQALEPFPRCKVCDGLARPNILMFGDWSWNSNRTHQQGMMLQEWLQTVQNKKLVIVEVGAGRAVPTVRHLSESVANQHQATLIRINPRDYDVPSAHHVSIPLGGAEGINKVTR
jgi:NAD-dependent SIR2 family protein deacetylase